MLTKKTTTILLSTCLFATIGISVAAGDDYNVHDFNRLLKGDKNLADTKLEGADLRGKNLSGVDFRNADLEEANLSNADLTNANFQNADLEEANLKGAKIKGAIFKGAELEFATWVDGRVCAEGSIGGCW
ncbi:MAG: pentapeptide repeat-containing protein [Candidatus Gastranaerophilales bacterium]|nr:pentapeptide repeat-containing protein [Candidatus Gastranaerophilales bacterium]